MRAVDRYITYYKVINDNYIDEIVFDRLKKTMILVRDADEMVLGSVDTNDNYFIEIELPDYIFELVASSIEGTNINYKHFLALETFHLYSNLKGKRMDIVIESKNKIYFTDTISYFDNRYYFGSAIEVNYRIMEVIIKQLEGLGYKDVTSKLKELKND